ncbi:MAG TPA: glycosyltransferase family 9 protein [Candidatus Kapabacteria bacterium]|nr:glycosyltransferase family 9 protein [Candidatus Kapabacteria bacterium]
MNGPPLVAPMIAEGVTGNPLGAGVRPEHILVVRLHAFGDAVIALPLLAALRRRFPSVRIGFVTSALYADLFREVRGIDDIHAVATTGSKPVRAVAALRLARLRGSVSLLLDIQRSRQSEMIRSAVRPRAWAAFDRFAPRTALDRYLDAAESAGLGRLLPEFSVTLRRPEAALSQAEREFMAFAAERTGPVVCLNPAGCWPTKNWPPEYYTALGSRMIAEWGARLVLLGTENVRAGASVLAERLRGPVLNLVGRTTIADALRIVQRLNLMVSDDSGLMHLAWISGVPTVAMFGASRSSWSRPYGAHTYCFGSEDLPCGACMSAVCGREDLLCLRRVDPDTVFHRSALLLGAHSGGSLRSV